MKTRLLSLILVMLAIMMPAKLWAQELTEISSNYVLVCDELAERPGKGNLFGDNHFLDVTGGTVATNKGAVDFSVPDTLGENGSSLYVTDYIVSRYGQFGKHLNYLRLKNAQDVISMKVKANTRLFFFLHGNNQEGLNARIPKISQSADLSNPLNDAPTENHPATISGYRYDFVVHEDMQIYIGSYNGDLFVSYIIAEVDYSEPEPYAVLSEDGLTVTFYYDDQKSVRGGININNSIMDSNSNSPYGTATTAVIDTSFVNYRPTSTAYWFDGCSSLNRIIGIENLKTDNVTDMSSMFSGCSGLTSLDVSKLNTDNVTGMSSMFSGCSGLTSLDVSSFKTDNVTDMSEMFFGCSGLTSLDLSKLNTDNVTDMSHMFSGSWNLTSIDLSSFNTQNVTNMSFMFYGCFDLQSLDVTHFNTANVTNMRTMFYGIELASLDLSNFNTANVMDMSAMFSNCSNLTTIFVGEGWSTDKVGDSSNMFSDCTSLVGGMGTAYDSLHVDYTYARIDGGPDNPGYFTDKSAAGELPVTAIFPFNLGTEDQKATFSTPDYFQSSEVTHGSNWSIQDSYTYSGTTETRLTPTEQHNGSLTDDDAVSFLITPKPGVTFTPTQVSFKANRFGTDNGLIDAYWQNPDGTIIELEKEIKPERNNTDLVTVKNYDIVGATAGDGTCGLKLFLYKLQAGKQIGLADIVIEGIISGNGVVASEAYAVLVDSETDEVIVETPAPKRAETAKTYTLKFYYDTKRSERNGMSIRPFTNVEERPWHEMSERIGNVIFDSAITNDTTITSTAYWFYEFTNMKNIDGLQWLNTKNVTDMGCMFSFCTTINWINLSNFNTSKVTNMDLMFNGCSGLTSLDLSSFNTANVTSMHNMFMGCSGLTSLDLSNFNTANVTGMNAMFFDCSGLTSLDLSNFNTDNTTEMLSMFTYCSSLTTIYAGNGWNTTAETYGKDMFKYCTHLVGGMGTAYDSLHVDHTYAHIDGGPDNPGYFTRSGDAPYTPTEPEPYAALSENNTVLTFYFDDQKDIRNGMSVGPFESNIYDTVYESGEVDLASNMPSWYNERKKIVRVVFDDSFANYTQLTSTHMWFFDFTNLTTIEGISNLRTDNVTTMGFMFCGCSSLNNLDVSHFNTEKVRDMVCMFRGCSNLTSLDLSNFYTNSLGRMSHMFRDCTNLKTLDVSHFNTSEVSDLSGLFYRCINLRDLDLSSFNTANVTTIALMFYDCSFTHLDLSGFITAKVENMNGLFQSCSNLKSINLSNFNTTNVERMSSMFFNCYNLTSIDISGFSTDKVKYMSDMFSYCSSLTTIYVGSGWTTASVTESANMFNNCSKLVGGAGTEFDANHTDDTYARIDGGPDNPGYFTDIADTAAVVDEIIQFADANVKAICVKNWDTNGDGELSKSEAAAVTSLNQVFYRNGDITSFDEFQYFTGVKEIGEREFMDCSKLSSIILPSTLESINREAFYYCGLSEITIPASVISIHYAGLYQCFRNIYVDSDNPNYCSVDGVLYSKDLTKILCYPVRRNEESYTILSSVTVIGGCSFYGSNLKIVEIPSGVTRFEQGAFRYCHNLVSVDIPEGIEIIESENYQYCNGLQSVSVPASVTSIAFDVFNGCPMLQEINVDPNNQEYASVNGIFYNKTLSKLIVFPPAKPETSFEIPEGVTEIGTYAFYGCKNLTAISIPQTVNTIGYASFTHETYLMSVTVFKEQPIRISDCFTDETFQNGTLYVPSGTKALYEAANGWKRFLNIVEMEPAVDYAFDTTTGVLTISGGTSLADALSAAGGRDEVAKTITAILWENDMPLTNSDLQGLDNPNMLIYVKSDSLAPVNRDNVVVNGFAKNIVLTDVESGNNNFYCPGAFKAEMISYTRNFQQQTEIGVCRGWETIALPFDVQTIMHENGLIAPFGSDASTKHFWLRQLTYDGIAQATAIEANTPYIISMPNSNDYPAEFNQAGRVTFSSQNAVVPVTSGNVASVRDSATNTMIVFYPTMQRIAQNEELYALNVGDPHTGYAEGSVFVAGLRDIRPFECYTWHHAHGPAPQFIPINELNGGATGIETIDHSPLTIHQWYDLNGRRLQQKPTRKGVYILNGRAVVIK